MSADVGLLIEKTKKGIRVLEISLSGAYKSKIGSYKTVEEALRVVEDIMEVEGNYWEAIFLKGFN